MSPQYMPVMGESLWRFKSEEKAVSSREKESSLLPAALSLPFWKKLTNRWNQCKIKKQESGKPDSCVAGYEKKKEKGGKWG